MAVYDLEEQEKLATLTAWWEQYGKYVTGAVTVVSVIIIAVQGWRWYTRAQSEKAAVLYSAVSQGAAQNSLEKAKDAGAQLLDKYPNSAYASRAALLLAKLAVDSNDRTLAKTHLQWVVDHASEDELKQIGRLRLAYVLLDEKAYDEALRTLDAKHDDKMDGLYADAKGDILAAAGKIVEAREAYKSALTKVDPKGAMRAYVQLKLDSLGDAK
ncbi:MAG: tetratricopeptide repeat protein [Betaproteobacteria bacterium]